MGHYDNKIAEQAGNLSTFNDNINIARALIAIAWALAAVADAVKGR